MGTVSRHTLSAKALGVFPINNPAVTIYTQGFESLPSGVSFPSPDGWTASGGTSPVAYTVTDIARAHSGSKSLSADVSSLANGATVTISRTFPALSVGRSYTFSAWGFGSSGLFTSTSLAVVGVGGSGPIVGSSSSNFSSYTFTATATSHVFQLRFTNAGGGTIGGGLGNWDDISVVQNPYTVIGDYPFDIKTGTVTIDDSWSPYAQTELTCWAPNADALELIDPRSNPRVQVTVMEEWGDGVTDWNTFGYRAPVTRNFNLALRERVVDKNSGEMTIKLESDEALLQDYGLVQSASDTSQFANKGSLRSVINYVLNKVMPGVALQTGADDAAYYISSENVIDNPRAAVNVTNYSGASNLGALTPTRLSGSVPGGTFSARVTATAASISLTVTNGTAATMNNLTGGLRYSVSTNVRTSIASSAVVIVQWRNAAGGLISSNASSAIALTAGNFSRIGTNNMLAPAGATWASVVVTSTASFAATTGTLDVTATRLSAVPFLQNSINDYFDGDSVADANYTYSWSGTAHLSHSTRTAVVPTSQDVFTWQPGQTAYDFIAPLVQQAGFRLWCNESRQWLLKKDWTMSGQINVSPLTGLTTATDTISRAAKLNYDSVVITYTWTDSTGASRTAYDIAGSGGNTLALSYSAAFPGAGAATAVLNRAIGKGRTFDLQSISDYKATPGMNLSITVPDVPLQVGLISSVAWSFPDDTMTIGSKGLTDTPPNAWILAPGSLTWAAAAGTWATYTN